MSCERRRKQAAAKAGVRARTEVSLSTSPTPCSSTFCPSHPFDTLHHPPHRPTNLWHSILKMYGPDADRRMPAAKSKRKAMREPSPAEEGEVVHSHTETKRTRRKKVREEAAQRGDGVIDVDKKGAMASSTKKSRNIKASAAGSSSASRHQTSARRCNRSTAQQQSGASSASRLSGRASPNGNTSSAQGGSSSLQSDLASLRADAASMRAASEQIGGVEGERILARIAGVEARAEGLAAALRSMVSERVRRYARSGQEAHTLARFVALAGSAAPPRRRHGWLHERSSSLRPQDDSCQPQ